MALSLVDIETDVHEASHTWWQLPMGGVCKDKSSSKEGSPFSQASTAPCTPIRFFLPDPFDVPPTPQPRPSFACMPDPFDVPPPLSICMSPWWADYKQAGKPMKRKNETNNMLPPPKRKIRVSKPLSVSPRQSPLSICMSPWWAQYKQGWKDSIPPVLRNTEPALKLALKSELAIWAQKVVAAKTGVRNICAAQSAAYVPRSQQHFAVLEVMCKHENLLEEVMCKHLYKEHLPRRQQQFAVLEVMCRHDNLLEELMCKRLYKENLPRSQKQFAVVEFVTKQEHKLESTQHTLYYPRSPPTFRHYAPVHLVDDDDRTIEEPTQDLQAEDDWAVLDGDEEDDEWLKVDDLYTPSGFEGMCVLTSNPDSVGVAGRALTPDGRVIDLDGGGPVAFPCEAEHASGHIRKTAAISMAKASANARMAKAASDVDTETVCSIDTTGTVYGALSSASDAAAAQTKRLKLFHKKRKQRQATRHSQVCSLDASGRLFLFSVKKCGKRHRKVRVEAPKAPASLITIDTIGVVRKITNLRDVCQRVNIDPNVVLTIYANRVIRALEDPFAGL